MRCRLLDAREIRAGQEVLKSPKPNPDIVKVLLITSLTYIATKLVDTALSELANQALDFVVGLFKTAGIPL